MKRHTYAISILASIVFVSLACSCNIIKKENADEQSIRDSLAHFNSRKEVGTLTAYYAKEDFSADEREYKKGELICDSNDPFNHVSDEDENNYRYSGDNTGVEYSWLLPKSKVEKKVYTMNQLALSDIEGKAYFVAENGFVARIFWSNSNGHGFYNWNGEEKFREKERFRECFVLSAELVWPWDNSKHLFEEQLDEKLGNIKLYSENIYRQYDHLIGFVEESWDNKEGWDYNKSAYDTDGNLLVDQWKVDGIPDYISIAYIEEEDALYINGILYYRHITETKTNKERNSNKNFIEMLQCLWE